MGYLCYLYVYMCFDLFVYEGCLSGVTGEKLFGCGIIACVLACGLVSC